jgi:site-specific recombinase XerD
MDTSGLVSKYEFYLSRLPISVHTRRNYLLRVKLYLQWLEQSPDSAEALTDPLARDFAVQEYRSHLLRRGSSSNTVNANLAALGNLYLYIGLGPAKTKRQELPQLAPKGLDPEEQRRFLRAVATCESNRNRALIMLMLHCGLRLSEVSALDLSDVVLTARRRELTVRCGKNSKRRVIPINKDAADALLAYLAERRLTEIDGALFLSRLGNRLSNQAIDHLVRALGRDAGIKLSSHTIRHTCISKLIRAGIDLVTVAEVAGHSRLETTRRYSLPTEAVKIAAMEKLSYSA